MMPAMAFSSEFAAMPKAPGATGCAGSRATGFGACGRVFSLFTTNDRGVDAMGSPAGTEEVAVSVPAILVAADGFAPPDRLPGAGEWVVVSGAITGEEAGAATALEDSIDAAGSAAGAGAGAGAGVVT